MKKLVIGYIANGKSTNRYHLPFALKLKDKIKVKTIYARHLDKKEWARIEGIKYTDDINELYNDDEINTIIICTGSGLHYQYVKDVLNAGKNCVCEKPFMETVAEAEECFKLAHEKGLLLECYQNRRFDSDFLTVQKVVESGKLGELLELEMSFDYYRPYSKEQAGSFSRINSFYYGHACHTLDQVISYWGKPDKVNYDVRQLYGEGKVNDYFDLDLYYGIFKVSIKSSFFRVKARPSFVIYGRKGVFVKETKDLQERDLKRFYMPDNKDFGIDTPNEYGTLTYYDDDGVYHEEKVPSVTGGYEKYYEALYETIMEGKEPLVKEEQTLLQLSMLEEGIKNLK